MSNERSDVLPNKKIPDSAVKNRNKRFLANIQSTLGGGEPTSQSEVRPRIPLNFKHDEEEETTLSDALRKIAFSNEAVADTLVDVKPFLIRKAMEFSDDDFSQLATALCSQLCEQTNNYFILDICSDLIVAVHQKFQLSFSECLKNAIGKFLNKEDAKWETVPNILAQFLSNKWPRKFNRAAECSNMIMFTTFNTIIGWIKFVNENCREGRIDQTSELFLRCTEGLLLFCNTGQRFLWMTFPELYDDIYNLIVEILVSDVSIPRSLKYALLNLHNQMGKWSQANKPKYSHATTQTVGRIF